MKFCFTWLTQTTQSQAAPRGRKLLHASRRLTKGEGRAAAARRSSY